MVGKALGTPCLDIVDTKVISSSRSMSISSEFVFKVQCPNSYRKENYGKD